MEKYNVKLRDPLFYRENVPCMQACPVHTDAGKYVELISKGNFKDAYLVARSPNPMATSCGRICSAPCEDVCARGNYDEPVTIRALKRFLTEKYGSESKNIIPIETFIDSYEELASIKLGDIFSTSKLKDEKNKEFKIAVIGSGPAGIACAHDLALMGYNVSVFETHENPGGMLSQSIPHFRLPNDILFRETFTLSEMGVELVFNHPITGIGGIQRLKDMGFGAVFIAAGASLGKNLKIEGSDFNGVYKALDFLFKINKGQHISLGKKVVVIGGGLVAIDAARTAVRGGEQQETGNMTTAVDAARSAAKIGAIDITLMALESEKELPSSQTLSGRLELKEMEKEGIKLLHSFGPKRFIGKENRVKSVEIIRVKNVFDEKGSFNPTFIEGSEEELEADSVIMAIGQASDLSFINKNDGIEITPWGTIKVDQETLQTSSEGIFAGGDVVFGPRIAIEAVENGKRAAISINDYFKKKQTNIQYSFQSEELIPELYNREKDYEKLERNEPDKVQDTKRIGLKEVEETFSEEEAVRQAKRCLQCRTTPIYEQELCILCGFCAEICPENVLKFVFSDSINFEKEDEITVLNEIEEDNGTALIKDENKCIRCGMCAQRCPTNAIKMEQFTFKEKIV